MQEKKFIRQKCANQRKALSNKQVEYFSHAIFTNIIPLLSGHQNFFIYCSFNKEVETKEIIDYLLKNKKNVFLPKIKDDKMFAVKFNHKTTTNCFGISEPVGEPEKLNSFVSIVPALAVDVCGNRLGFGKGFYDKFLSENACVKIAICYDFQVCKDIPSEKHDVKMDCIVTPTKIINCKTTTSKI